MAKSAANQTEPTFEVALARLEQIVGEMEGDRLTLEDLLARYEEGTALVKVCQQRLDSAEKRIEIITRGGDEAVRLETFDPSNSAPAAAVPVQTRTSAKKNQTPAGDEDVSLF